MGCAGRWKGWSSHLTVARVAEGLGVAWGTANDAVLAEGKRALIEEPRRGRSGVLEGLGEVVHDVRRVLEADR